MIFSFICFLNSIVVVDVQVVSDSRYYVVRYTSSHTSSNPRYRYVNSTVLNCMLDDLKPNTQFEFAVKVIKV